jgi:hypothetical protein
MRHRVSEFEAENTELLKSLIEEYAENEVDIAILKTGLQYPILFERIIEVAIHKLETRNAKLKPIIKEYTKKLENEFLILSRMGFDHTIL